MAEEFEFRDLSDAVFWGVDLQRVTFRDVDLSGSRVTHARLVDVEIDAEIDRLVVNGVDVTGFVNERDPWFPLRSQLRPSTPEDVRRGWTEFAEAWTHLIEDARQLPIEQHHASVDGEWSLVETVRHLVFATDKWFTVPVADGSFHPIGLPNSGSVDFGWPGIDPDAAPDLDTAVGAWQDRSDQLTEHLSRIDASALEVVVGVLENGPQAVHDCIGVVFEEHFQHLRYARRDLALLR